MNLEDMPDWQEAVDPVTQAYNPLHPAARAYCEKVCLPQFAEAFAAGKESAYIEALRLIAEYQVAPPPWLAKAMLNKIRHAEPRTNEPADDKIFAALAELARIKAERAKRKLPTSIDRICQEKLLKVDGEPISKATLNRWMNLFRSRLGADDEPLLSTKNLMVMAEAWASEKARANE